MLDFFLDARCEMLQIEVHCKDKGGFKNPLVKFPISVHFAADQILTCKQPSYQVEGLSSSVHSNL